MAKERVLDLFGKVLPSLDMKNMDLWKNLKEDEKKEFHPRIIMRFMSAVPDSSQMKEYYLLSSNELVNVHLDDILTKQNARGDVREPHYELACKLLAKVGIGSKTRHEWIKVATSKKSKNKIDEVFLYYNENLNDDELEIKRKITDSDDFYELALGSGLSQKDAKALLKEYKVEQ